MKDSTLAFVLLSIACLILLFKVLQLQDDLLYVKDKLNACTKLKVENPKYEFYKNKNKFRIRQTVERDN